MESSNENDDEKKSNDEKKKSNSAETESIGGTSGDEEHQSQNSNDDDQENNHDDVKKAETENNPTNKAVLECNVEGMETMTSIVGSQLKSSLSSSDDVHRLDDEDDHDDVKKAKAESILPYKAVLQNVEGMESMTFTDDGELESRVSSSDVQCQEEVGKTNRRRHSLQSTDNMSDASESPPLLETSEQPGAYHVGSNFREMVAPPPVQFGRRGGGQQNGTQYHGELSGDGNLIGDGNSTTTSVLAAVPPRYGIPYGIQAPLPPGQLTRTAQGRMESEGSQLTLDTDLNSLVPADSTPDARYLETGSSSLYALSGGISQVAVVHAHVVVEQPFEERFAAEIEARLQAEFQGIATAEVVIPNGHNSYSHNTPGNDILPGNNSGDYHPRTKTEIVDIDGEEGLEGRDVSEAKVSARKRKWIPFIVIAFVVGLAAIGTFIVVRMLRPDNEDDITLSPSTAPAPSSPTSQRYNDMRQVLLSVSSEEDLDNESSPQFRAMEWLLSSDGLQLDPVPSYDLYQRYIVVVLYFATKGEKWNNRNNFLTNTSICDWNNGFVGSFVSGLVCYDSTEDLEYVGLSYNGLLGGPIPPEIGWLSSLAGFNVRDNKIIGAIPSTIGALTNLVHLTLSSNILTGSLPSELREMQNLMRFEAAYNVLTGTIPNLSGLSNLNGINLEGNVLSGSLSGLLGDFNETNLPSLKWLDLSSNQIRGSLPSSICNLTSLELLEVDYNFMEGQLPLCLSEMDTFESVYLDGNTFTGSIELVCPSSGGRIRTDCFIGFECSCCTGCCYDDDCNTTDYPTMSPTLSVPPTLSPTATVPPTSVSADSSLTYSAIREVLLNVTSPSVLDDPSSPQNQAMVWLIEDDLRQVPATNEDVLIQRYILAVIYFAMNGPQWTDNLNFLSERSVCQWNSDDDSWPNGFFCSADGIYDFEILFLSYNNLSFSMPPELGYLPSLQGIELSSNSITGTIPTELGLLTNLLLIGMWNNSLTGQLPSELGSLTELVDLYLGENRITGTVPSELGNLLAMTNLDLSYNKLEGIIPSSLGSLSNWDYFYLNGNDFSEQDLDPIFCPLYKPKTDVYSFPVLQVDCLLEVSCTCCTCCNKWTCCDGLTCY